MVAQWQHCTTELEVAGSIPCWSGRISIRVRWKKKWLCMQIYVHPVASFNPESPHFGMPHNENVTLANIAGRRALYRSNLSAQFFRDWPIYGCGESKTTLKTIFWHASRFIVHRLHTVALSDYEHSSLMIRSSISRLIFVTFSQFCYLHSLICVLALRSQGEASAHGAHSPEFDLTMCVLSMSQSSFSSS